MYNMHVPMHNEYSFCFVLCFWGGVGGVVCLIFVIKKKTELVPLGIANVGIIKPYIKDYSLQPLLSTLRSTHTHTVWDHCFAMQMSEGQCALGWTCSWWENLLWWWRFVPNELVHEQVWMSQLRVLMRGRLRWSKARRRWREGLPRMEGGSGSEYLSEGRILI